MKFVGISSSRYNSEVGNEGCFKDVLWTEVVFCIDICRAREGRRRVESPTRIFYYIPRLFKAVLTEFPEDHGHRKQLHLLET